jgi:hypothetical protein
MISHKSARKKIANFFAKKPLDLPLFTLSVFLAFWDGLLILNAGVCPQIAQMGADFLMEGRWRFHFFGLTRVKFGLILA